jgi:hypothetical protein
MATLLVHIFSDIYTTAAQEARQLAQRVKPLLLISKMTDRTAGRIGHRRNHID